jgi:hypothetical protein
MAPLSPEDRLYRAAQRRYRQDLRHCRQVATPQQQADWTDWYEYAHVWCADVAQEHGLPIERVAALLAVTSPQLSYDRNKAVVREILDRPRTVIPGIMADVDLSGIGITNDRKRVALAILRGDPVPTTGPKVWRFYRNILGDRTVVTIDRHMIYPFTDDRTSQASRIAAWQYRALERAILTVAAEHNLIGYQLQALLWGWYRRDSGWAKRDHLN